MRAAEKSKKLKDQNSKMKQREICAVCEKIENSISILFIPCGHRVCCFSCAEAQTICPQCDLIIDNRIKSYLV